MERLILPNGEPAITDEDLRLMSSAIDKRMMEILERDHKFRPIRQLEDEVARLKAIIEMRNIADLTTVRISNEAYAAAKDMALLWSEIEECFDEMPEDNFDRTEFLRKLMNEATKAWNADARAKSVTGTAESILGMIRMLEETSG